LRESQNAAALNGNEIATESAFAFALLPGFAVSPSQSAAN